MDMQLQEGDIVVFVNYSGQEQLLAKAARVVQHHVDKNLVELEARFFMNAGTILVPRAAVALLTPQPEQREVYKRYLCTHPLRTGRLTLYMNGQVSWAHMEKLTLLKDCPNHGKWEMIDGKLYVNFHHQGKADEDIEGKQWTYVSEHVYVEYVEGSDIWHLAGVYDAKDAVKAAVLEPWGKMKSA